MTSANPSAMRSPVRFMARGLAEGIGDEKGGGQRHPEEPRSGVSKDGYDPWPILRGSPSGASAPQGSHLRMTAAIVEAKKVTVTATAAAAAAAAAGDAV